jgi:hypothetical protein
MNENDDPKACKRVWIQRLEPKTMLNSGENCELFTYVFFLNLTIMLIILNCAKWLIWKLRNWI